MTASKVVRSRGSVMAVTASAEIMFGPQGQVTNWTRQFSNRVTGATRTSAPRNSRPTWGHEPAARGKSLKESFTTKTMPRPQGLRVFAAVGSSSPYSAFVDQGTGIYAGNAPWEAKILPPTSVGGSNLYENTWRPAGPEGDRVSGVVIKGQKPQYFFARGLTTAFRSVGMATVKVPSASLASDVDTFPEALAASVIAATSSDAAFQASLETWRAWRDAAWSRHEVLGDARDRGGSAQREIARREGLREARLRRLEASRAARKPSAAQRTEANRIRQARRRAQLKDVRATANTRSQIRANERQRFLAAAAEKYGARVDRNSLYFEDGYWFLSVRRADGTYGLIRGRKVE